MRHPTESCLGNLLKWFAKLSPQAGVGPFLTLSGVVVAIVVFKVNTIHQEKDDLARQLSAERERFESSLNQIQADIANRIPSGVRSPLPISPENERTLVPRRNPRTRMMEVELEWADPDRAHRHKYALQRSCIAPAEVGDAQSPCKPDNMDSENGLIWTEPGVDRAKVKIKDPGTYVWRIARASRNDEGEIATMFEDWSPYYIFKVFSSTEDRVKMTGEVLVGVVDDPREQDNAEDPATVSSRLPYDTKSQENEDPYRQLQPREKKLFNLARAELFPGKRQHYIKYVTHEDLLAAVLRGEVDYAIGGLTRTKYREERGMFFTRGYDTALPIFVSKWSRTIPPRDGDTIGVLRGTNNERALTYLVKGAKTKKFVIVREPSLSDLEDELSNGSVDFIFTEPKVVQKLRVRKFGTMYSDLRRFYVDQLGYFAQYAIATADEHLCRQFERLIKNQDKPRFFHKLLQRVKAIYHDEGEHLNNHLFWRIIDELRFFIRTFLPVDEHACINQ